jgi:hypothetical protein
MQIRVQCACGKAYNVDAKHAGRKTTCKVCGGELIIPGTPSAADLVTPRVSTPPPRPGASGIHKPRPAGAPSAMHADLPPVEVEIVEDVPVLPVFVEPQPIVQSMPRQFSGAATSPAKTNGMAVASLVLAIPSFCLNIITAVPAIILGIMALRRISDSQGRESGQGLAIAGIVVAGLAIPLSALILIPAAQSARMSAHRVTSAHSLKQLALAVHTFYDNKSAFPQRVEELAPYVEGEASLRRLLNNRATGENPGFVYIPPEGGMENAGSKLIIAQINGGEMDPDLPAAFLDSTVRVPTKQEFHDAYSRKLTIYIKGKVAARQPQLPAPAIEDDSKTTHPGAVFLDDLAEVSSRTGWGSLGKHGATGYPEAHIPKVLIRGKTPKHALSASPPSFGSSEVVYDLAGKYKTFHGGVAIADSSLDGHNPITFVVWGDNKVLWKSKVFTRPGNVERFKIDIRRIKTLRLQVECPQDHRYRHAVWIEPALEPVEEEAATSQGNQGRKQPLEPSRAPNPNITLGPDGKQVIRLKAGAWVECLHGLDIKNVTRNGKWSTNRRGDVEIAPSTWAKLSIPTAAPSLTNYDIRTSFTRLGGNDAVLVIFPVASSRCQLVLDGWGATLSGLQMIDGKELPDVPQTHKGQVLTNGRQATMEVSVRVISPKQVKVTVHINGEKLQEFNGDPKFLSSHPGWNMTNGLGIGAYKSQVAFHSFEIKVLP